MKLVSQIAVVVLLAFCVNANALYDVGQKESQRDVAGKPADRKVVALPAYSPTQVLCVKQRRKGSRVMENKCQTLAKWKQQMDESAMRNVMIKARGKRAAWETQ